MIGAIFGAPDTGLLEPATDRVDFAASSIFFLDIHKTNQFNAAKITKTIKPTA